MSNENNTVDDNKNGLVAQLNRASDYGSEGYRFESCRGHKEFARTPFFVQNPIHTTLGNAAPKHIASPGNPW